MDVCPRCGKPGHAEGACNGASIAPQVPTMPPAPLGASGSIYPSGSPSGSLAAAQTPASRELRMLKTQLALAIGQREEDPERAWLELVSVRERLQPVADTAREDPLLLSDLERFRTKLDEQIAKLTRDVGDEVIAPLYAWVDLLRQRASLEAEVDNAARRVGEARASRGSPPAPRPSSEEEAEALLAVAERELAGWSQDLPPAPSAQVLAVWLEAGGDALRPSLPLSPTVVRNRGRAALAVLEHVAGRAPGAVPYVGSKLELVLLPIVGAAALLLSMFALATTTQARAVLGILAASAWVAFAGVIAYSVLQRQKADVERRAALEAAWHHVLFKEQASSLDLEVGWLRALVAALRARHAFDAHKGEGGNLAELSKWRPDLEPVVAEVAKSSLAPPR